MKLGDSYVGLKFCCVQWGDERVVPDAIVLKGSSPPFVSFSSQLARVHAIDSSAFRDLSYLLDFLGFPPLSTIISYYYFVPFPSYLTSSTGCCSLSPSRCCHVFLLCELLLSLFNSLTRLYFEQSTFIISFIKTILLLHPNRLPSLENICTCFDRPRLLLFVFLHCPIGSVDFSFVRWFAWVKIVVPIDNTLSSHTRACPFLQHQSAATRLTNGSRRAKGSLSAGPGGAMELPEFRVSAVGRH